LSAARSLRLFAFAFAFSFACGLVVGARRASAGPETLARARAERLAAAGRCEEALAVLDDLARAGTLDATAHVVAGQCQLRLERYPDAARSFEAARSLDRSLPQLDLQLGIAQFLADDLDGAATSFAAARAVGTTGPEIDFYEALVSLSKQGDPAGAATALERAGRDRPRTLDPAASYYAGLAWRSAQDEERARAALERVVAEHPDSVWGDAARKALAQAQPHGFATAAPWAQLEAGLEWDSNVAYLGRGLATPDEIGSSGDVRGVWSADVGIPIARLGSTTIGARASYTGSAHTDVTDFDLEYPYAAVWLEHPTGEHSLFRLEVGGAYGWLGYDPYVAAAPVVTPQWFYDHGKPGVTRLYATAGRYNFLSNDGNEPDGVGVGLPCPGGESQCGPAGVNERKERDRDGYGVIAGVEHSIALREGKTILRGGPLAEVYTAKGDEWDAWGVGGEIGVRQALPYSFVLDTRASYVYRPYSSPSTYPDPNDVVFGVEYPLQGSDRRDHAFEVDVQLERPITPHLTASIRYDYLKNASNVAVFDYDRHLVGGYLTFTWQGAAR